MSFFTKKNFKVFFSYKNYKKKGNLFFKENFKKINLKSIFYFFPFFYSFLEIINFKYKNKKFFFFFERNFLIKEKLEEKISWETFNFFKLKDFIFFQKNIKQYNVYNDYFFIEVNTKNLASSIGFIKKKKTIKFTNKKN